MNIVIYKRWCREMRLPALNCHAMKAKNSWLHKFEYEYERKNIPDRISYMEPILKHTFGFFFVYFIFSSLSVAHRSLFQPLNQIIKIFLASEWLAGEAFSHKTNNFLFTNNVNQIAFVYLAFLRVSLSLWSSFLWSREEKKNGVCLQVGCDAIFGFRVPATEFKFSFVWISSVDMKYFVWKCDAKVQIQVKNTRITHHSKFAQ